MANVKYFLFKREAVTPSSESSSDTGDNLSLLAVPAHNVSYISALSGQVVFVFNEAGIYDHYSGAAHEAMQKTQVVVSCKEGEEETMVQEVLAFIGNSENRKIVMRFDAVDGISTLSRAQSVGVITPKVFKHTTEIATGVLNLDPQAASSKTATGTTIGGVVFPSVDQRPTIDYNETAFSALAIGTEIGHSSHIWSNQGTGGSAYDITANTGAPVISRARNNKLDTNAITVAAGDLLHLDAEFETTRDYTMYMVYALSGITENYSIYSDAVGRTKGFGDGTTQNRVFFTFDGHTGRPAFADTTRRLHDPKLDDIELVGINKAGAQTCYVFVIRRDKDFNIYVHDYTGDEIAYIPANVGGIVQRDFRTDGDLVIDRIGGDATSAAPSDTWKGEIARFGVIEQDIGGSSSAKLARDLFDRYNYYSF